MFDIKKGSVMSLIYFGTGLTVWFAMCNWGALQETTTCGVSSPPHWRKNAHFRSINETKMHSVLPFCLFICFVELFIVLDLANVFTLSSVHIYRCQLLINVCIYIGVPPLPFPPGIWSGLYNVSPLQCSLHPVLDKYSLYTLTHRNLPYL